MATNINNKLVCNEPHANLDSYYGPYDSVHAAYLALADTTVNGVNYTKKYIGLTVGVWNSSHNEIIEYWFKGGLNESNLVLKTCDSGGLPDGVKVVTFDKNGGSGVQNSLLTDTSGQLRLPECTFTKSGDTFKKWLYNGSEKSEGDIITVTTSTAVKAVWQSTPTQYYTVSWITNPTGLTITGEVNKTPISSGTSVSEGTVVVLTATPSTGYQFVSWVNKPSGSIVNANTLMFTVNSNISGISATAEARTTYYTVSWITNPTGLTITGKANGTSITTGAYVAKGATVVLTAIPGKDYQLKNWVNKPLGAVEDGNTLTFTLNDNTSVISAVAESVTQYYTVSWINTSNVDFIGMANGEQFPSGSSIAQGTTIVLTALLHKGYQLKNWTNKPLGAVEDGNTLTFTLNSDATNISADTEVVTQYYTVSWTNGNNISISGKYNENTPITSGSTQIPAGSTVVLTATPDEGYKFSAWSAYPSGATTSGNTLTIQQLSSNVSGVTAVASINNDVYTYASETEEFFTTVEGLILQNSTTVMFEPYNFKSYYAVVQTNVAPKYRDYVKQNGSIVYNSDFKDMLALNECGNDEIIKHFVETMDWVESGSNKTKGELKSLGNYIFILKDDTLINKNVEIKFR